MLQILGIKRVLFLILLVAANAGFAASVYLYVLPQNEKIAGDLRSVKGQISIKRAEVDRLQNEFIQIQQQKSRYEALQAAGFMSDQNRLVARRRIMNIQQYTRVSRAAYDISSASVIKDDALGKAGYVILSSPVKIDLESLDDLDLYNFIYWMNNAFPGHTAIKSVKLERTQDINETTLRAVGTGASTALVKGTASFVWRTVVPETEVQGSDFGTGGF